MTAHSDGQCGDGRIASWEGTRSVPSTDGVTVALHDLGGDGPPLLFCHPTGFHGLVWAPVAAALGDLPGASWHRWAPDFRGHGDTPLPASGRLHDGTGPQWTGFAEDVLAAVDELGGGPLHGVGLSMGGACLLQAEEMRPGTFAGMWLYEPIVFPTPPGYEPPDLDDDDDPAGGNPMSAMALRRRAFFESREAALANYSAKPPLGGLDPAALAAYVEHGLGDLPDGGVTLKCAPKTEARIFMTGMGNGIYDDLEKVACPVTVAASGDGGHPAQAAPLVAEALPNARLERFDGLTHFGPMEDPARIAAALTRALAEE
jgi:pimeloyl-ACP methyl ester carboxylesterase